MAAHDNCRKLYNRIWQYHQLMLIRMYATRMHACHTLKNMLATPHARQIDMQVTISTLTVSPELTIS